MIFDIWRKLRVFFIYAHLYSLMPSDPVSIGRQRVIQPTETFTISKLNEILTRAFELE